MARDLDFIEPDDKRNLVVVKVDPRIYPVDLIYNAAYSIMEKAYVILEGSLQDAVYAILKPRNFKGSLRDLGRLFYDELTASAFYAVQLARNRGVREALIQGLSNRFPVENEYDEEEIIKEWEDKFGDSDERDSE